MIKQHKDVGMRKLFLVCLLLGMALLFNPAYAAAAGAPDGCAEKMDSVAAAYIGTSVPGACVIASEHGETVFSKGYGFADIEKKIPMDAQHTVFEWGSISKTFVWVSVMQLVETGEINLTEDIRHYLPEGFLQNLSFDEPVAMIHLMNHTAGFEEELLDLRYYAPVEERPLGEVMAAHQPKQVYAPGAVSAYSNWGAALAALVVEQVSGQSYRDYVKEHILVPLGMAHTAVGPFWTDVDGLLDQKAQGYSYTGSGFKAAPEMHLRMYPAGAMNGTGGDLLLFANELAKTPGVKSLLFRDARTKELMFSETGRSYGANAGLSHGFWQYVDHPGVLGHEGGTYGFKTQFWVEPEHERAVLILTNAMETDFCSAVMKVLATHSESPAAANVTAEDASLVVGDDASLVVGDYHPARAVWSHVGRVQGRLQMISISKAGDGKLRLTMPFGGKNLFYEPVGGYRYHCADAMPEEQSLAFVVSDGTVRSMSFRLAHDYVPAGPFSGTAVSVAGLAVYLLMTPLWVIQLVRGFVKLLRKKPGCSIAEMLLPAAGAVFGTAGTAGMLHWFLVYNIVRTEINFIAVAGMACAIIGVTCGIGFAIKNRRASAVVFTILFGLQVLAAWSLGFLTLT